jgi:hypothetical protein
MRRHNHDLELTREEKRDLLVTGAISAAITLAIIIGLVAMGRYFLY